MEESTAQFLIKNWARPAESHIENATAPSRAFSTVMAANFHLKLKRSIV